MIRAHQPNRPCAGVLVFLSLILINSISPAPAQAQDERMTVRVDGRALFRLGPLGDVDAATRARRVEQRIATLLEAPQAIAPALVQATSTDQRTITVSGVPVVTVSVTDAQDNLTTVDAVATQWQQTIDAALQRAQERRQSAGGRFVAEVRASVASAFARLIESTIAIVPRAFAAALVIGLFWAIAYAVRWLMRMILHHVVDDLTVENLIKQLAYYAVWILGLIVAVDALGFAPQTVVTGLGLTSLALGFALKDILSNFVSGILILTLRPFELGDQIVVGVTEGSVERIQLRATQIRTYDGRVVVVPNAEVFTSRIINNTAAPVRRGSVELLLGYETDLQQATSIIRTATQQTTGVLPDPPASIRIRELTGDGIVVEARFWTDSRRADFLATASGVRGTIVAALRAVGAPLPEPGVRILVPRNGEQWRAALGNGVEREDRHV